MSNETIDLRSLSLAVGYIACVRDILKEIYPNIPDDIKKKYRMKILDDGLIDIQFPEGIV